MHQTYIALVLNERAMEYYGALNFERCAEKKFGFKFKILQKKEDFK
jgi:hypothetical protein